MIDVISQNSQQGFREPEIGSFRLTMPGAHDPIRDIPANGATYRKSDYPALKNLQDARLSPTTIGQVQFADLMVGGDAHGVASGGGTNIVMFAASNAYAVRYSNNSGQTWTALTSTQVFGTASIYANGWATDGAGGWMVLNKSDLTSRTTAALRRSTDGGATWVAANLPPNTFTIYSSNSAIAYLDNKWIVYGARTTDGAIVASTSSDFGATWSAWVQITPVSWNVYGSFQVTQGSLVFSSGRYHLLTRSEWMDEYEGLKYALITFSVDAPLALMSNPRGQANQSMVTTVFFGLRDWWPEDDGGVSWLGVSGSHFTCARRSYFGGFVSDTQGTMTSVVADMAGSDTIYPYTRSAAYHTSAQTIIALGQYFLVFNRKSFTSSPFVSLLITGGDDTYRSTTGVYSNGEFIAFQKNALATVKPTAVNITEYTTNRFTMPSTGAYAGMVLRAK